MFGATKKRMFGATKKGRLGRHERGVRGDMKCMLGKIQKGFGATF